MNVIGPHSESKLVTWTHIGEHKLMYFFIILCLYSQVCIEFFFACLVLYWYFSVYTRTLAAPLFATPLTTTSSGTMAPLFYSAPFLW